MIGSNRVRGLSLRKIAPEIAPPLRSNSSPSPAPEGLGSSVDPFSDVLSSHGHGHGLDEVADNRMRMHQLHSQPQPQPQSQPQPQPQPLTQTQTQRNSSEIDPKRRGRQLADVLKQMYEQAMATAPRVQKSTQENEVDMLTNVLVNSLFTCTVANGNDQASSSSSDALDTKSVVIESVGASKVNAGANFVESRGSLSSLPREVRSTRDEEATRARKSSVPTVITTTTTTAATVTTIPKSTQLAAMAITSTSAGNTLVSAMEEDQRARKSSTGAANAASPSNLSIASNTTTTTSIFNAGTGSGVIGGNTGSAEGTVGKKSLEVRKMESSLATEGERCARCKQIVFRNDVPEGSSLGWSYALDRIYHNMCFDCIKCGAILTNQPYYAWNERLFCERCYTVGLETCVACKNPICDRIIRAMGQPYHSQCFRCARCDKCLDGVAYTVTASNQIYCLHDFYQRFAIRCAACGDPIVPNDGSRNTLILRDLAGSKSVSVGTRVVAQDCSFHVDCYRCIECGSLMVNQDGILRQNSSADRVCDECFSSASRRNSSLVTMHEVEV